MEQFRKFNRILMMIMSVAILGFVSSCDDDEEPNIPSGGDGIPVADGFYLNSSADGAVPSSAAWLKTAKVDAEAFQAMDRENFVQGYMYLTAGSYNLVEVASKAIVKTYGGTVSTITGDANPNKECGDDDTGYSSVAAAVDGAAFAIAKDGLYVVAYDGDLGQISYDELTSIGIIGDATPGGWSTDTEMTGAAPTAAGGAWEVKDVTLNAGVMKFRFNCRWAIDRRLDTTAPFDNANGYSFFTNYGGTIDDLKPGNEGANIPVGERAQYDVTFAWDPSTGVSATMKNVGAAPVITYVPEDWGLIGDATAKGWDADMNMFYKGLESGTHSWYTVLQLADAGSYKFRANDSWDKNLGGAIDALTFGGADLATPGAGSIYLSLHTADDGATFTATQTSTGWGVIGDGSPQGNWDADIDMVGAFADGVETYTVTGDFTTAEWKFRAGDDWAYNLGVTDGAIAVDGGNIALAEAGNYTVVLSYDGTAYTYTATKN
jgi:hypothetical protein